jgi:hypothetical protein
MRAARFRDEVAALLQVEGAEVELHLTSGRFAFGTIVAPYRVRLWGSGRVMRAPASIVVSASPTVGIPWALRSLIAAAQRKGQRIVAVARGHEPGVEVEHGS